MLENLYPRDVFSYFEKISSIPRGSGNCINIADYIESFAHEKGLCFERDHWDNVIIKKPGTSALANAPVVMLQGHLDMVCEKVPQSLHDFERDPLPLQTDGKEVWSEGTTLGADDGIAIAMMLALLADETAALPPLECVFTTDEEIGLIGAQNLDLSRCNAKYLINLDCDEDGVFIAGCCGGVRVRYSIPVQRVRRKGSEIRLTIDGLQGGHSGAEIHKNGANAVRLMARLLHMTMGESNYSILSMQGGDKDNVIPDRCTAEIIGEGDFADAFVHLEQEYRNREPNMQFTAEKLGTQEAEVLTDGSGKDVLQFLAASPCGVLTMHPDIAGVVGTSANLAAVNTKDNEICGTISVRSETLENRDAVCGQIGSLLAEVGGSERRDGAYPGWEYSRASKLRQVVAETWHEMFGVAPKVEVIHAGLECGVLQSKLHGLDIISFGPKITGIHTVSERLDVESVCKNYRFLLEVLNRLGRNTHA